MDTSSKISVQNLTNVPETMLVPLYFKAKETKENGIIKDDKAVEIVSRIDYDFSRMAKDWKTQTGMAVRTHLFDNILKTLSEETAGKLVVVNLGAGLDTRQERFPGIKFYQLDLLQSIAIRKQFFDTRNAVLIPKSILDFSWMDDVGEKEHVLFIAEGLFMYFNAEEVRSVLTQISAHFTKSFLVFNSIHKSMMGRQHTSVDTSKAPFKWGIQSLREVDDWHTGWKQYQTFFPPDYFKKRWGWMRWLGLIPTFRAGFVIAVLETEK